MSAYNYGYGAAASIYAAAAAQPAAAAYQAASYAAPAAATAYGYATSQPAAQVAPVYQTQYTQPQATAVAAATTGGGYGYFQRAADPATAAISYGTTAQQKPVVTAPAVARVSYGSYGTTASAAIKTTYAASYAKPQAYISTAGAQKPSATSAIKTIGSSGSDHKNAYEKVVYNAATSFLTQQSTTNKSSWTKNQKPQFRLNSKAGFGARPGPPKPQQLHYCEVCKISCGAPQTYKEHLEGSKHKKKAASAVKGTDKLPPGTYKCELCDVTCTGRDAYAAHLKGANHQKVVNLHKKLGKPVPDIPIPEEAPKKPKNPVKTTAPKMNFVGGSKLVSTGGGMTEQASTEPKEQASPREPEENVEPVGEDKVENVLSDMGKIIGYKCTLCDCRFNDILAKTAHCKGRRHRLAYKKKVDPTLEVKMPNSYLKNNRRNKGGSREDAMWKQREVQQNRWEQALQQREEEIRRWEEEEYLRRVGEDRYWTRPDRTRMHELEYYEWERREHFMDMPKPLLGGGGQVHGPDDRLVRAKHDLIYPNAEELAAVQSVVGSVESALRKVSDAITEEEKKKTEATTETSTTATTESKEGEEKKPASLMSATPAAPAERVLKGVMRVGVLAKGLLLKGNLNLELVVLCAEKPTYTLLKKVGKLVPEKLKEVTEEKLTMSISVVQCAILISTTKDPKVTVKVTFTSPTMREDPDAPEKKEGEVKKDPKDVLDKEKCLQALAALRHAKWFQARPNQVQSCVITIRIMNELCTRNEAFKPLNPWAVELLCEKCLASYPVPISPGEAFRRVMESLATGILLEGGPGLLDPCEKEPIDAVGNMSKQERENITAAAQHAVRLQAFRQLHKVLEVDPLVPIAGARAPKRAADTAETTAAGGKVVKKE